MLAPLLELFSSKWQQSIPTNRSRFAFIVPNPHARLSNNQLELEAHETCINCGDFLLFNKVKASECMLTLFDCAVT
jgi:hypothetical protein